MASCSSIDNMTAIHDAKGLGIRVHARCDHPVKFALASQRGVTLLAFPLELKLENCIKVLLDKRAQSKAGCEHRSRCVCIQLMKCLCAVRRTCAKIRSYWPRSKCRQNPAFARHVRVDPFADLPVPSSWLCGKPRRTLVSILEEKENTHKAKNNNFVPCVTS